MIRRKRWLVAAHESLTLAVLASMRAEVMSSLLETQGSSPLIGGQAGTKESGRDTKASFIESET